MNEPIMIYLYRSWLKVELKSFRREFDYSGAGAVNIMLWFHQQLELVKWPFEKLINLATNGRRALFRIIIEQIMCRLMKELRTTFDK